MTVHAVSPVLAVCHSVARGNAWKLD